MACHGCDLIISMEFGGFPANKDRENSLDCYAASFFAAKREHIRVDALWQGCLAGDHFSHRGLNRVTATRDKGSDFAALSCMGMRRTSSSFCSIGAILRPDFKCVPFALGMLDTDNQANDRGGKMTNCVVRSRPEVGVGGWRSSDWMHRVALCADDYVFEPHYELQTIISIGPPAMSERRFGALACAFLLRSDGPS